MDETLDSLPFGNLQLLQAKRGYRYSLDPVLLARFVRVRHWKRVFDLGTGSGILPLLLARLTTADELIGIERQENMAERAQRNVALNDLQDRVQVACADIRALEQVFNAGRADLVVTNPPYRVADSGRIAPEGERAAARHELAGGLADFVACAGWLLKFGGMFCVVHLAERLPELICCMKKQGIEPKRLRVVYSCAGDPARLVLVEGRKGGRPGLEIESPLNIYSGRGSARTYTEELLQMYEVDDSSMPGL